jgi:hypothetical protein
VFKALCNVLGIIPFVYKVIGIVATVSIFHSYLISIESSEYFASFSAYFACRLCLVCCYELFYW